MRKIDLSELPEELLIYFINNCLKEKFQEFFYDDEDNIVGFFGKNSIVFLDDINIKKYQKCLEDLIKK